MLYQGNVTVGGDPFGGTGFFKFIITNAAANTTYWSNNGSSTNGSQPTAAVPLAVSDGYFSVLLGDTALSGMTQPLSAQVFAGAGRYLRVWFASAASGTYSALSPQPIGSAPYALNAETLDGFDGSALQLRVSGTCAVGNAIRVVNPNGTVTCEPLVTTDHNHWAASWSGGGRGLSLTSTNAEGLFAVRGLPSNLAGSTAGQALWGSSEYMVGVMGTSDREIGVFGKSDLNYGVLGSSSSHDGVRGTSTGGSTAWNGVYGHTNSTSNARAGVYGVSSAQATGVTGDSQGGYGVSAQSDTSYGIYANTEVSNGYGLFTNDNIGAANYLSQAGFALVARNGSQVPLQVGEVVALAGLDAPLPGSRSPTLLVQLAQDTQVGNVVGVVQGALRLLGEGETPMQAPVDGPAQPGDLVVIQVQGLAQVRVSAGPVRLGDLLTAGPEGLAQRAEARLALEGVTLEYSAGTILGKALEAWEGGDGLIWVLVDLR
jgi:hypothetical protein